MIKLYQTDPSWKHVLGVVFWGSYTIHDDQSHGTRMASSEFIAERMSWTVEVLPQMKFGQVPHWKNSTLAREIPSGNLT